MEFPDLSGAVPPLFLNLSNTLAVSQKKETMKAMKQNTKNSEADAATARDVNSGKKKVRRDAPQPHCIHDQKTTGKEFTGAGQASPVAADPSTPKQTDRIMTPQALQIQVWPIDRLIFYARNARRNDAAVPKMCSSIREFGFKVPVLARSDGEVVDGHLRLKAARKLGITEVPVILCDEWTPAQVKAFRLVVNRSVTWADWDDALLTLELQDLAASNFDLSLTGFDPKELDDLLIPDADDQANSAPPLPENPVSRLGDLWLCGNPRPRQGLRGVEGCPRRQQERGSHRDVEAQGRRNPGRDHGAYRMAETHDAWLGFRLPRQEAGPRGRVLQIRQGGSYLPHQIASSNSPPSRPAPGTCRWRASCVWSRISA